VNEGAMARVGLQHQQKKKINHLHDYVASSPVCS